MNGAGIGRPGLDSDACQIVEASDIENCQQQIAQRLAGEQEACLIGIAAGLRARAAIPAAAVLRSADQSSGSHPPAGHQSG